MKPAPATEPYRPSNGSEGEAFRSAWCAKCHREVGARQCRILTRTLVCLVGDPDYPKEWVYDAEGHPRCTAFVAAHAGVRSNIIRDRRQGRLPLGPVVARADV